MIPRILESDIQLYAQLADQDKPGGTGIMQNLNITTTHKEGIAIHYIYLV